MAPTDRSSDASGSPSGRRGSGKSARHEGGDAEGIDAAIDPTRGPSAHSRLVSGLSPAHPTAFEITPTPLERAAIARMLGFSEVRKLRFVGEIAAEGKCDWRLTGMLGATLAQPCVVTLDPVVTRIDAPAQRRFLARWDDRHEAGSETEMPEDDTQEPLGTQIDPWTVMIEALALEAPDFPRSASAGPTETVSVTEPGKAALTDDDVKPFADLAALKAQMDGAASTPDTAPETGTDHGPDAKDGDDTPGAS